MKRTIILKDGTVYYRNVDLGELVDNITDQFDIRDDGKYSITVEEDIDGVFSFESDEPDDDRTLYHELHYEGIYIGIVCMAHFDKLFFTPDERKNYNIIVKKVN